MSTDKENMEKDIKNEMSYFLKDVASYLFHSSNGDLSNTIVIFPNRRARLYFNQYLSQLSDRPIWAPQYFTISDFIQNLSGLQLADQLTLVFKLFKVYREITSSKESFDEFYFYCETLLSDFDDIDKNRVDARMLFKNLSDLKSMEDYHEYLSDEQEKMIRQFWDVFAKHKPSAEMKDFISMWDALQKIYIRYNEILDAEGIAYEGKSYKKAIDILESEEKVLFDNRRIAFVGFNALNRSEEILFEKFRAGDTLFFWDYDMSYIESDIHEAGFFLREYLKKFPQPADYAKVQRDFRKEQSITTVSVPSNISQGKVIHHFLDKIQFDHDNHPSQAALVLADENLLLPVINSLPPEVEKINISMGYPVLDTPVYGFISSLVDLHTNKRRNNSSGEVLFYHRDFFSVLNHPFLLETKKLENYSEFEKFILEKNISFLNPVSLKQDDELYLKIFSWEGKPQSFGSYLNEVTSIVIERLIQSGKEDNETKWQLEVLHAIQKMLVRFDSLLTSEGIELKLPTVFNLLRRVLAGISVPFSGEPLVGLQIMGILETRTLDFENLIILSMNEGKFPKSSHVPSLIPYSLREGFGLPTIRHQDAIYGYYFYRLLHRARNVILLYNTRTEGLQKGEPSRYILQLRYSPNYKPEHISYAYKIDPFPIRRISADKSPEALETLSKYKRPGGSSFLSPSALNVYLNCKLRFYFRYIEGMKESDNVEEDIESNVFGSILHKAMEILYSGFCDKQVNRDDIIKLQKDKKIVSKAIDTAFKKVFFGKKEEIRGRNLMIKYVIEKYINGILDYDLKSTPFNIHSLEQRHDYVFNSIAIGGYIDRLDQKDGHYRVIDYKTGKADLRFKNIDDLFDSEPSKRNNSVFQTFLYSWILNKKKNFKVLQPSLFFVRNIYNAKFDHKIIQSENRISKPLDDISEYLEEYEERLSHLIHDLFDPSIAFTQTDDADYCSYCPYNAICFKKVNF